MNLLAIGPHPDDIEIGCAGSILKWRDKGFNIKRRKYTNKAKRAGTLSRDIRGKGDIMGRVQGY
jgi:hypothetical protein